MRNLRIIEELEDDVQEQPQQQQEVLEEPQQQQEVLDEPQESHAFRPPVVTRWPKGPAILPLKVGSNVGPKGPEEMKNGPSMKRKQLERAGLQKQPALAHAEVAVHLSLQSQSQAP